ncbi:hypothetical protein ACTJJ0_01055 [Chitinophaga sp. 22321]|uniref:Uncharacterized protein n=1 Tax=Chitinophaga hostae TaxID=2831022 RepID=A0ABS5IV65_9BACT|nr:hypothetical protein [Chitinophaga hostae]MBS0026857.1 hypothetical protein [Chitinophaga hostae]
MHFSFGENNTLKLIEERSYTDFSYKFNRVTNMITEQKETDIYPTAPGAVTICKFSYIKVQ